jgi:predicted MFS family arabinose efflux permease
MSSAAIVPSARRDAAVIGTVGFAHGTSHFFHMMIPPLYPWLMPEFGLGYAEVGALMTAFFVVSGIGQAFAGFAVDRFGAHRVLAAGLAVLAVSGLLLAAAANRPMLFAAAIVAGLGNSVFHPADFALLNHRVSVPRLGHAFSVHGLSGNLGWAAGAALMTAIAAFAGWRGAALSASLFGLVALALLFAARGVVRDVPAVDRTAHDGAVKEGTFAFLGTPLVWYAFAFFMLATLAYGALQNFAPSLFRSIYGLSLALATSALTAYLIGGGAGMVTGGFFASGGDRQERIVGVAFFTAALLSCLLASGATPPAMVVVVMAAMGFGVGFANPSRDMLVRMATKAEIGPQAFGRVYGFVYSGLDVGLATAPLVFGILLDRGEPNTVLWAVAASQCLAIVAALLIGHRKRGQVTFPQ